MSVQNRSKTYETEKNNDRSCDGSACMRACHMRHKGFRQNTLFDNNRVHTIEILIDEADWADLLAHPEAKTKYEVSAVIDGETVKHVAFSAKGNSSLAFTKYRTDSSRCSFKLNFGKYSDGGTIHGLSKLNLNSGFADVSYLKEYLACELFRRMNVPAPLCSFVMVKINGKDHGLYMAAEEEDSSFISRALTGDGTLASDTASQNPEDRVDASQIVLSDLNNHEF